MFGGPQQAPSKEELEAQEMEALRTVQNAVVTCAVLYLSPFAISWVRKLF